MFFHLIFISWLFILGPLAPEQCIICLIRCKTADSGSGYEELLVCKTAVCAERLYQHCINSNNNHVEAQVVACNSYMDLIAREFRYHRSCYKKLCWPSKENSVEEQPQKVKWQDCIDKLKEYVNELVIRNGQIIRVSDIAKRYVRLQEESDISSGSCETRMVKSLLINVFGDKISFVQKKIGTAEFVFATENDNNDRNEQNLMFMTDVEKVKKIAAMIKNEITTFYDDNPIFSDWPTPEDEIKADIITLPPLLSSLISTLLTNEGSNSSRCTRLVRSLSQDVIYACSRGKLKTVKHTQLGFITKRKTGSKFLINCLNRLGHCLNYDDINKLETSFAEKQAIHIDTTSCFSGIGKTRALKILKSNEQFFGALSLLGEHEILSQTTRDVLEEYVCSLYGFKNEKDINVVRYKIFTNGKKLPDPQRLPPTSDALQLHFRRSNYQVYEWKNALNCDFEPLDPNGNGWYIADGMINIKWQTQLPAPEAILQFVSCECKKSKCANNMCRC